MARENSIQYELKRIALADITDKDTVKTYEAGIDRFATYCREVEGINKPSVLRANAQEVLQRWEKTMEQKKYTAATIHTRLSAPCKGLGISMRAIDKPKRTAGKIVRSRGTASDRNPRDEVDKKKDRFSRLVDLQACVGIRRNELRCLKGRDLVRDESNQLCVAVEKGKEGKVQLQRILPTDEDRVREIFKGVSEKERVFTKEEMSNHLDLHSMRGDLARRAYKYYADRLQADPKYHMQLMDELMKRYEHLCGFSPEKPEDRWKCCQGQIEGPKTRQQAGKWIREVLRPSDEKYFLRGKNKEKALAAGVPVVYDRMPLLAVSVLLLSHWRLDVTVTNYMIP